MLAITWKKIERAKRLLYCGNSSCCGCFKWRIFSGLHVSTVHFINSRKPNDQSCTERLWFSSQVCLRCPWFLASTLTAGPSFLSSSTNTNPLSGLWSENAGAISGYQEHLKDWPAQHVLARAVTAVRNEVWMCSTCVGAVVLLLVSNKDASIIFFFYLKSFLPVFLL